MMAFLERLFYNLFQVHPLHPMIVHFPIALTATALFFILVALRYRVFEQFAFANLALASVSTIFAGVTGFLDNQNTFDGAAPNANVKIVLAMSLFVTSAVISLLRWKYPAVFASRWRWLYLLGYFSCFALAAVLGFLGGVINYGFYFY